jgi:putative ABC transport system substrate-binding protein
VKRRDFITLLAGAAASWPAAVRAAKPKVIELLGSGTTASHGQLLARFVERLRELGWTEGRDVIIEYRWAEGKIGAGGR